MKRENLRCIVEFIGWSKDDWIKRFHEFSKFYLDFLIEIDSNYFYYKNHYDDKEFGIFFAQVFDNFHRFFILNNEENSFQKNSLFFNPLEILIHLSNDLICDTSLSASIFLENDVMKFVFGCILNNSKFSKENLLREVEDLKSYSIKTNHLEIFLRYNFLLLNLIKFGNLKLDEFKYDILKKLDDSIEFLKDQKKTDSKNILLLKYLNFLYSLRLFDEDFENSTKISNEISDFIENIFHSNLTGEMNNFQILIYVDELLEIFLLLAKNKENSFHLKRFIPFIFKILHSNFSKNVEILALNCIFSIIEIKECKELIIKNSKFMEKLKLPVGKKNVLFKFLQTNILHELEEDEENHLNQSKKSPIFFSFHENDKENTMRIIHFFQAVARENNIFLINLNCNSKRKKNKFLEFLNI